MLTSRRFVGCARRTLSGFAMVVLASAGARAQAIGVSTGLGLQGGAIDPNWRFIPGLVDYRSPNALKLRGRPAVVMSRKNMGWWTPRSKTPEKNINNGWIGASDTWETAAATGPNTMRLVLDLSKRKLSLAHLAGTAWGDLCVKHIYVNGKLLSRYIGSGFCRPVISSREGTAFSVGQADGLIQGVNVIDFVYVKQDADCDGIRVDFHMIFRETRDRPLVSDTPPDSVGTTSSPGRRAAVVRRRDARPD